MSVFTISKRFRFEASHSLPLLPEGHKCRRLHGHSYAVWVELSAPMLDKHGFVRDYGDLGKAEELIATLDHRNLDDFIVPSSAETLAVFVFGSLMDHYPELVAVRVSETETSWAEYRP